MNQNEISIAGLLREGWELTKVNIGFLVVYQIILYFFVLLFGFTHGPGWQALLWQLVGVFVVSLVKMGFYKSTLIITTGNKPTLEQTYSNWPKIVSWIIANFLFGLLFVIGFILLIIPAFYVLGKFGLFPFFILDKNLGPIEALKAAGAATKGNVWSLVLLFIVCILINLAGLLFFGIGLFITAPVTLVALATVYRQLTGQSKTSIQPSDI